MSLSSAKWGEQLFKIYFYHHSSVDIRPLSLLGLATVSLTNLLHSSASFITNHLFYLPWLLCTTSSTSESGASLLRSLWKYLDPGLVSPYYLHQKKINQALGWSRVVSFGRGKIPPVVENWQNQLNAICSLILPLFQKLIQEMDHSSSWRTWSRPEKNPSRQSEHWDLCNQHKLEHPKGCSKLCLEFFQVLIRMKCSLGLLFSIFIYDEHKLETKIHKFSPHCR